MKAERKLRRSVHRNRGCLSELGSFQRRVLRLRAGIGDRPSRSRRQVARRLDVRGKRVARAESRGLTRLRSEARDGCGETSAPVLFNWTMPVGPLALASPTPDLVELASLPTAAGAVLGAFRSSGDEGGDASGLGAGPDGENGSDLGLKVDEPAGDGQAATRVAAGTGDDIRALPILLLALLALAGLGAYFLLLRGRRGHARAGGAAAESSGAPAATRETAETTGHAAAEEPLAPWLANPPARSQSSTNAAPDRPWARPTPDTDAPARRAKRSR